VLTSNISANQGQAAGVINGPAEETPDRIEERLLELSQHVLTWRRLGYSIDGTSRLQLV
jgi:hypothetical protein